LHDYIPLQSSAQLHSRPGFRRTYVFSVDHKIIGIQYAISALVFLLVGFSTAY
jgi:cytochrome c oxidase subunit 1